MILSDPKQVREIYKKCSEKGWVLPCFCTENLTTTEAVFSAAKSFGEKHSIRNVPVIIAITCTYSHRPQAVNFTHSGDYKTGLKLFENEVRALTGDGCYYEDLHVMMHLDHIQHDEKELLDSDLGPYASIMYDASQLVLEENISKTAKFVDENKDIIVIEGACDEIIDAGGEEKNELTDPKTALEYINKTGVDFIVANLGTEHRATGKQLKYYDRRAAEIKKLVGEKIVLHGTSSVSNEQVKNLFKDGICKVNIWTALERDSTPVLFEKMVENASETANSEIIQKLVDGGYLTQKCMTGKKPSIDKYTTKYRQDIVFGEMKRMVSEYLDMWYVV